MIILFWIGLLFLFSCFALLYYAKTPSLSDGLYSVQTVEIPAGTSFYKIVEILHEKKLVKHRLPFYLLAFSQKAAAYIRAGEYELSNSMSPLEMLRKLVRGEIKGYPVTFPEDITLKEIAARLAERKLADEKTFMEIASDREFLASLGIEGASLEGFLYPDTYLLNRSMGAKEIIRKIVSRFRKKVTPEMLNRAEELGLTLSEIVTLASIIGKESGNKEEKPLVSAVFHNRLRKKMKLQSDPTAVYDLYKESGVIKKSDLKNNTPYNTYLIDGLPPGPIANPGIDSLQAALYPANVDYFYFVSKKDGTHCFSKNLSDHNEAVSRYQAGEAESVDSVDSTEPAE